MATIEILYNKNVSLKLKGKFYKLVIRSSLLYGSECLSIKKKHERKMEVVETRMLVWTCGRTLFDRIPNMSFRNSLGVASIIDKLKEKK